jgi:hypothetical protein
MSRSGLACIPERSPLQGRHRFGLPRTGNSSPNVSTKGDKGVGLIPERSAGGKMMRGWLAGLVLGVTWLGVAGPALAQDPPSPARQTQQDRMRQCNADAKRDELKGEARRSFMRECLSRRPAGEAQPSAEARPAQGTAALAAGVTGYRTEAEAKAACGDDTVVWGSRDSRVFHLAGSRFYGKTQHGSYLCRSQAELGGYRTAR